MSEMVDYYTYAELDEKYLKLKTKNARLKRLLKNVLQSADYEEKRRLNKIPNFSWKYLIEEIRKELKLSKNNSVKNIIKKIPNFTKEQIEEIRKLRKII